MEVKLQNLTQQLKAIFQQRTEIGNSKIGQTSRTLESPPKKSLRQSYGGNGHDAGGIKTRYTKLDFSTYNESEDPLIRLYRCEQFFYDQRIVSTGKVNLAVFHMLGDTQFWYYELR